MTSLWQKPELADITLRFCDSSELMIHKVVVCQCDFFRAACSGDFKVCEQICPILVVLLADYHSGSARESHQIS